MSKPTEIEITSVETPDSATLHIRGTFPESLLKQTMEDLKTEYMAPQGDEALQLEAATMILSDAIENILTTRSLESVGGPELILSDADEQGKIEFVLDVALYPSPEIIGYEKFEIEIESRLVTEKEITSLLAKMLSSYREEQGDLEIELSDEVARDMVQGVEGVRDLRERIREEEQTRVDALDLEEIRENLFSTLVGLNDFALPNALIDDEIRSFVLAEGKADSEHAKTRRRFSVEEYREEYQQLAEERARLTVIIDRISEVEGIFAEEEDIEEAIEEIAKLHGSTFEETHEYLMENGFILEVILAVTQEKVFEFLLERAVIKRKNIYH